jgi:hypothetical protein
MSGTKRGVIVPNWQVGLDLQCRWAEQWLESVSLPPALAELQQDLKAARTTARTLAGGAGSSGANEKVTSLLSGAEKLRGELDLLLQRQKPRWTATEAEVATLRRQIAEGRKLLAVRADENTLQQAAKDLHLSLKRANASIEVIGAEIAKVNRLRRELQLWNARITKQTAAPPQKDTAVNRPTAPAPPDPEAVRQEIARQAAEAAAREGLNNLGATLSADRTVVEGRLLNAARWDEYSALLKDAEAALTSKDFPQAQDTIDKASALRTTLLNEARANAAALERNKQVAEAIMEALCDHHYNLPKYGDLKEGDPLSGIQIRADVPGTDGKGNVRVDLKLDGQAVFHLENVPQGEEALCRRFLSQMGNALSAQGMELRMEKPWACGSGDEPTTMVKVPREREHQRERQGR